MINEYKLDYWRMDLDLDEFHHHFMSLSVTRHEWGNYLKGFI